MLLPIAEGSLQRSHIPDKPTIPATTSASLKFQGGEKTLSEFRENRKKLEEHKKTSNNINVVFINSLPICLQRCLTRGDALPDA
jgi:hypothetical protein